MDINPHTVVVAAVALIFAVDKILISLRSRGIDLPKITKQIDELHHWHDRTDEDGVPVWYVRKVTAEAIEKIATNMELQTQLLKEIYEIQIELRRFCNEREP